MIDRDGARAAARSILNDLTARMGARLAIFDGQFGVEGLLDKGDAWLVNWNAERYLETGDIFDQVLAGPIVVPKDGREAFLLGTAEPVDTQSEHWRSGPSS